LFKLIKKSAKALSISCGPLSPRRGAFSVCEWWRRPPDMQPKLQECWKALADSRPGVVLWNLVFQAEQIFVWKHGSHFNYWILFITKSFSLLKENLFRLQATIFIETLKCISYSILLLVVTAYPTCKLTYKQNAYIN
jgi:hypothetical protein